MSVYLTSGTLAGVAVNINILTTASFKAKQVVVANDSATDYTVAIQGYNSKLLAGEVGIYTGDIAKVTLNGTGDYRLFASESADGQSTILKPAGVAPSSVSTGDLAPGVLSADAAGRALTEAGYFDSATVLNKFDANSIAASRLEVGTASAGIDGADVRTATLGATYGVLPVLYVLNHAADAAGLEDIIVDRKGMVIDAWFEQAQNGNVLDSVRLFNAAVPISPSILFTVTAGDSQRVTNFDSAGKQLAAGTTLRATFSDGSVGAGDLRGTFYVMVLPLV